MASKRPIRTLFSVASTSVRPSRSIARSCPETSTCAFSTSTASFGPEYETEAAERPRWQQTPVRMVAPFRIRPQPKGPAFKVNEDPRRLDEAYVKMLGPNGDKLLSEEVKWLAITHKSFDHGRRGFNDRLAFLGRRIVSLQTSLALLNSSTPSFLGTGAQQDGYGRAAFQHAALSGLAGLTTEAKDDVLSRSRLAPIAERYGLDKVTRWKPKRADNLQGSGQESVLSTSLYAIIGALALERGGEVANKVTQDKILSPLGFTFA
ncbi:ribonuclease-III-like-domain-containing protein [Lophiotrema nucula]|uniref:Ribonuclease-III-like-domain-containing protein n=1 Tax=Lophiotrema nucula TaxID=690887 RepID=A0A6A5YHT3_9PLEO|nr:ribonuclease-III-like-domain-containing protein [Lophiotrema nucula]